MDKLDVSGAKSLSEALLEFSFRERTATGFVEVREEGDVGRRLVDRKMISERSFRIRGTVLLSPIDTLPVRSRLRTRQKEVGLLEAVAVAHLGDVRWFDVDGSIK
jgi:hypothetical protein